MPLLNPSQPERFTMLVYPSYANPTHLHKIFDDPDFIQLAMVDKNYFDIRWASNADTTQSLELPDELIEQSEFTKGTISLQHTFKRPGTITGGANVVKGEAEDILNEVRDAGKRVFGYSLKNKELELRFHKSWPKTYHDIETDEVVLRMKRRNTMARYITDQAISLSAMEGLRSATDETLDEFGVYLPVLQRETRF